MSAATLVTETGTCQGCGETIERQPNAPAWLGTRDWHDPNQVDLDDNGTRCDGGITHHEPEPNRECTPCRGAGEIGTRQDYWGNWDTEQCRCCRGLGTVTYERATEWAALDEDDK